MHSPELWERFGLVCWSLRQQLDTGRWYLSGTHGTMLWCFDACDEDFLHRIREACQLSMLTEAPKQIDAQICFGVLGEDLPGRTLIAYAVNQYQSSPKGKRDLWQAWLEFNAQGWYNEPTNL